MIEWNVSCALLRVVLFSQGIPKDVEASLSKE